MAEELLAFGVVRLGASRVGFPLDAMSEVCRLRGLQPILVGNGPVLGALNLRGHMIPVLNLAEICTICGQDLGAFAVILRREDRLVAFPVDEVIGIVRIAPDRIQALQGASTITCVREIFLDGETSVSVIDLDAIFASAEVCSVAAPQVAQARIEDETTEPVLIFDVGGAKFSVMAEDVYGTVPRQTVEANAITSGFCMGSITYHRRRVPVLNSAAVFGLGSMRERMQTEVVVLRGTEDRLIGLAVDSILDVRRVDRKQILAIPRMIGIASEFLAGVMVREDGTQIHAISTERFLGDRRILSLTGLSSPVSAEAASDIAGATAAARGEVERFLVFKAGRTYAAPLSQVSCILKPPERVVPMTSPVQGLEGFFARDRVSVPLVDLNTRLGQDQSQSGFERVLLIGEGTDVLGFRVERVLSIESSSWLLKGLPSMGEGAEPLVQLGRGAERQALPVLDLDALRAEYFLPEAARALGA